MSSLFHILTDDIDHENKVSRSISAAEIANGVLIIVTTKQLDPVSNTYRIVTESTSFVPSSLLSPKTSSKYEYDILPRS